MLYNKEGIEIDTETLETCLEEFKETMFEKYNLTTSFPNKLLREDVINLLDRFCIVVFFPLEGEDKNHGFHIKDMPFLNGAQKHFVFINTAQTMDKQNFTAAHELGHIWKVDEYVLNALNIAPSKKNKELIINRFAAVLLMPKQSFLDFFAEEYKKVNGENGIINFSDFVKLSVNLMNHFFTPFKSVANRFFELGLLSQNDLNIVLNPEFEEIIKVSIENCIREYGYTKLLNIYHKKWIEDLPELLNSAEKNDLITKEKLDYLRKLFDLAPPTEKEVIENSVSFLPQKETSNNGD